MRGTLGSIDIGDPRGEYVIVLAGHPSSSEPPDDDTIRAALKAHLDAGATRRDAAAAVAGQLGVPKRTAYALATAHAVAPIPSPPRTAGRATAQQHTEGSR